METNSIPLWVSYFLKGKEKLANKRGRKQHVQKNSENFLKNPESNKKKGVPRDRRYQKGKRRQIMGRKQHV
jgi:hypothetical protein